MSFSENLMEQGGHPKGLLGKIVGSLMNLNHSSIYRWGVESLTPDQGATVLDIGCGGGAAIKNLAAQIPDGTVYGIDHSAEMVDLAKRVNRSNVASGRVIVDHASVSDLPYPDATFDIATAFETIQFWPNLDGDLQEVHRVLKPGGTFMIINRYPDLSGKNADWADVLQIHSAAEYQEHLTAAGYQAITIDDTTKPGWILVTAGKPQTP